MSLRDFFDSCEDDINIGDGFIIQWSEKGRGFGQYHFYIGNDGKIHIDNECDGKNTIKRILNKMVDDAILDDEPFRHQMEQENGTEGTNPG